MTVKKPKYSFDLDAVIAEREREKREPFTFPFDGDDYTLPPSPDIRADSFFAAGNLAEGFRLMFGEEQWAKLVASKKHLDSDAFLALYHAYQQHTGDPAGEAPASPNS